MALALPATGSRATRCLPSRIAQQVCQSKRKIESLQQEVDYWRKLATDQGSQATITRLQEKITRLESEKMKLRLDVMATRAKSGSLPADLKQQLPRLIQLCHPDRYGEIDAANTATVWLVGRLALSLIHISEPTRPY